MTVLTQRALMMDYSSANAQICRAFAHTGRLRILDLVGQRKRPVSELQRELGLSKTSLPQQTSILSRPAFSALGAIVNRLIARLEGLKFMEKQHLYRTEVEWTGERHGQLRAPTLPKLEVDAPPEFKGHEGVWTPEHLFVASVNSCFMTTFLAIAENSKLEVVKFSTDAEGTLENVKGQGLVISHITLRPKVIVKNSHDAERALRIFEKAEKHCLIANSIRTKTRLEPQVDSEG